MVTTTIKTQISDDSGPKFVATITYDVCGLSVRIYKVNLVFNSSKKLLTVITGSTGRYAGTRIVFPYHTLEWEESARNFITGMIEYHSSKELGEDYLDFLLKKAGIKVV